MSSITSPLRDSKDSTAALCHHRHLLPPGHGAYRSKYSTVYRRRRCGDPEFDDCNPFCFSFSSITTREMAGRARVAQPRACSAGRRRPGKRRHPREGRPPGAPPGQVRCASRHQRPGREGSEVGTEGDKKPTEHLREPRGTPR